MVVVERKLTLADMDSDQKMHHKSLQNEGYEKSLG